MIDLSSYEKIKTSTKKYYEGCKKIHCPYFNNEPIYFNLGGFNHLIYKNSNTERVKSVQILMFKLFLNARSIVKCTTTVQEYDEMLSTMIKKK